MRIISKFKDYYDSASYFGQDLEWIYNRNKKNITKNFNNISYDSSLLLRTWERSNAITDKKDKSFTIKKMVLGFCGQLIPFLKVERVYYSWEDSEHNYNSLKKEDKVFFIYSLNDFKSKMKDWNFPWNAEKQIVNFFNYNFDELKSIFIENHCPIFTYHKYERNSNDQSFNLIIELNSCLKDIDFPKIKNANEAYQEVFQYLSGVLGNKEKEVETIEDKYRVQQHGFDPIYGFRKKPKSK